MYASLREKVPPMVRNTIATSNLMVTVCFGMRVVSGNIVGPSETFTQDHFVGLVSSDPKKQAQAELTGRSNSAHGQLALPQRAESGQQNEV
jgi:hypothetical protein